MFGFFVCLFYFILFYFFRQSHYVALDGLELAIYTDQVGFFFFKLVVILLSASGILGLQV